MREYVIRWQQPDEDGKYNRRYLKAIAFFKDETSFVGTVSPELAIRFDEAGAEWICWKLDEQDDLNPEMIRI